MVSNTLINNNGYYINVGALSVENLKKVKKLTTIKREAGIYGGDDNVIKLYKFKKRDDTTYICIPRGIGYKLFGKPENNYVKPRKGTGATTENFNKITFELRENQKPAIVPIINAFNTSGVAFLQASPAFGKTNVALYLMHIVKRRTIIVMHGLSIIEQWAKQIRKFLPDVKIGTLRGVPITEGLFVKLRKKRGNMMTESMGTIEPGSTEIDPSLLSFDIVLATVQSVIMEKFEPEFFATRFDFAIFDEVHRIGATAKFHMSLDKIQTSYVLGMTAETKRRDELHQVYEAYIGKPVFSYLTSMDTVQKYPVIVDTYQLSEGDLGEDLGRDLGEDLGGDPPSRFGTYTVKIKDKHSGLWLERPNFTKMVSEISLDKARNQLIIDIIGELLRTEPYRHILILSLRRKHLITLVEMFKKICPDEEVGLILGGMKRDDLIDAMCAKIIFGIEKICAENFNVPELDTLILGTPGSNFILNQKIMRVLRKPHEHSVKIIDFVDMYSGMFIKQGQVRKRFYKNHKYKINIINKKI